MGSTADTSWVFMPSWQEEIPVRNHVKMGNCWPALGRFDDQGPAIRGDREVAGDGIGLAEGFVVNDGRTAGDCASGRDSQGNQPLRRDEVKQLSIGRPERTLPAARRDLPGRLPIGTGDE